jgi:hypothetical protein
MKIYGTNLKSAGRLAAVLLALAPGWAFGQVQTPPTRLARLANPKPASMAAPHAVGRSTSAAAQRYVFGRVDLATGDAPEGLAVGVFKNGGLPGIAVANLGSNTVTILLANSDGTYQPGVDYATGYEPVAVAVADFNGDHNLDLAVVNWGGTVSILLGNGDGTFQPQATYAGSGGVAPSIVTADFNGDKIPDLAVSSNTGGSVSILLGNGDGTFQAPLTSSVGPEPEWLAAADFNGDGHMDLAVAGAAEDVFVLLGNGDGTFQPSVSYAAGAFPIFVLAADFNGDGKPDLATANLDSNTVSVLLGNGDGTFQPHVD